MPLPAYPPALVQAPVWAGVGLDFEPRFADPSWPADWWQRNYDDQVLDPDDPDPVPLSGRQLRVPPPPVVSQATSGAPASPQGAP
jgi:hypothetical protein